MNGPLGTCREKVTWMEPEIESDMEPEMEPKSEDRCTYKIEKLEKFTNKKSTIISQSQWKFVKITISWLVHIAMILDWLHENCGFSYKRQILGLSDFLSLSL